MFSGFMVTVGDTYEEALARRHQLLDFMGKDAFDGQIRYLSAMIGVNLHDLNLNEPLPKSLQYQATPNPGDPRSLRAVRANQTRTKSKRCIGKRSHQLSPCSGWHA